MKKSYEKVFTIKHKLQRALRNKGLITLLLAASSLNAMAQEAPKETKEVKAIDLTKPSVELKGRVLDEKGQPLEGATILIKGTNHGVISDKYGEFLIRIPEGFEVVMISHINMKFQEINVKDKTFIKISMESSGRQLDEVVVVGYGKQQKKDVVTAVSTIQAEEIMQENQTNIGNAIQGKVPGATVISSRGTPGKTRPQIFIRGVNSKQTPLIVVDGVPRYTDGNTNSIGLSLNGLTIDDINPDEVESISVLKDNAATAVYGTRGSFGVIVVTTKRGKIGKPQFSYSTNLSVDEPANFPKLFDSYKYALVQNEISKNSGQTTVPYNDSILNVIRYGLDPSKYANENLYDRMVQRTATQQSHSLSVRGGTEAIRYYINGSFNDQKGIINAFDAKRYTIQSNVDFKITPDIKLGLSTGFRTSTTSSPFNQTGDGIFADLFVSSPLTPFYNKDGSFYGSGEYNNKLANTMPDISGSRVNKSNNISIQANFEYSPSFIDGLTFKLNNSLNFNAADYKAYKKYYNSFVPDVNSPTGYRKTGGSTSNSVEEQLGTASFYNTDIGFDYVKAISKHRIGLTVLGTNYYTNSLSTTVSRDGLVGNLENISSGRTLNQITAGTESEEGKVGGLARLNYDYAGKYSLEFSVRADASDNFPKTHRWGVFSGGAVAWRMSEENFIKNNLPFVNDLKVRVSMGYTGIDNLADANYYYSYNVATSGTNGGAGYAFGTTSIYQPSFSLNTSNIPNLNVTWGKSLMRNLGVDFSLWKGLLSGTFDIYDKKISDLPQEKLFDIPATFGIGSPLFNFAKQKYNGFEASLSNNTKLGKDMSLQTSFSFSYTNSRVVDYGETAALKDYQRKEGHSPSSKAFYKSLGIFQTQEEITNYPVIQDNNNNSTLKPGDIKYADLNGDKKIDLNDQEVYDDTTFPPFSGGLNLTFRYKSFSVNAFFQGAGGNMVQFMPNIFTDYGYNNSWRPENTDAPYPRISNSTNNTKLSSQYLLRGDYIRFKNVGFAYNIPGNLVKRIGLSNVSISAKVLNLMSFSTVKDIDPEVMENASTNGGYYPIQRNYSLGINIGL